MDGRMLPAKVLKTGGGVARNIADALGKLGMNPFLISAIGNDDSGARIIGTIPHISRDGLVKCEESRSGTTYVICDRTGECKVLLGDMDIHKEINGSHVEKHREVLLGSSLLLLDGNLSRDTINHLLRLSNENGVPVWFEPTDIVKATKAFSSGSKYLPDFISPNFYELREICRAVSPSLDFNLSLEDDQSVDVCIDRSKKLVELVGNIIVTLGKRGVLICRAGDKLDPFYDVGTHKMAKYRKIKKPVTCTLYQPEEVLHDEVVNTSGAGDCFASGFIASMLHGEDEESCVRFGFKCSLASLRTFETVPNSFFQ